MSEKLKVGDHVRWNSPQGETSGHITQIIDHKEKVAGHTVNGSKDDPRFEVSSERSGKRAVHQGSALTKIGH